jgi:pyrrolidone-carboxylate peptidase
MLDTIAENQPDRRPAILVCIYEADDPLSAALDTESGAVWAPAGARVRAQGPDEPTALADVITRQIGEADCRAVLLVGRTRKSNSFRVQMRAENRTPTGGAKVSITGPAMARATAPAAEIVRELIEAGLAADATSDSEEDVGSYLLYRILTALPDNADAPSVGLLRVPALIDGEQLRRGVQTAAAAMARHLSPLPRARLS